MSVPSNDIYRRMKVKAEMLCGGIETARWQQCCVDAQRRTNEILGITGGEQDQSKYQPSRAKAMRQAWAEQVEKLEKENVENNLPVFPCVKVDANSTIDEVDIVRDFKWAYQNIMQTGVMKDRAASPGALLLLECGREDKHKFLQMFLKVVEPKAVAEDKEDAPPPMPTDKPNTADVKKALKEESDE